MDDLFRLIDREVWIVTAAFGRRRGGLVATWVQASSLDPAEPIVTISISENHFTRELIDASGVFALHLLAEDQTALAFNFCCDSGRDRDKFADVKWSTGSVGCPLLGGCIIDAECRVVDRFEAAGRVLYFADVVSTPTTRESRPLSDPDRILQERGADRSDPSCSETFAKSGQTAKVTLEPLRERALVDSATPEQRAALGANRQSDIAIMRQAIGAWRARRSATSTE